jgi:hypothetical protein
LAVFTDMGGSSNRLAGNRTGIERAGLVKTVKKDDRAEPNHAKSILCRAASSEWRPKQVDFLRATPALRDMTTTAQNHGWTWTKPRTGTAASPSLPPRPRTWAPSWSIRHVGRGMKLVETVTPAAPGAVPDRRHHHGFADGSSVPQVAIPATIVALGKQELGGVRQHQSIGVRSGLAVVLAVEKIACIACQAERQRSVDR